MTTIITFIALLLAPLAIAEQPCAPVEPPEVTRAPWRRDRTVWFTVPQGAARHRCMDGIAVVGEDAEVACKFAYGPADKDLEGEDVEVFLRGGPCTTWTRLGGTRTDGDGRLHIKIPADAAPPRGRYLIRAVVGGDGSAATATLYVVSAGASVAVFDIDGTLTVGDAELFRQIADRLAGDDYHQRIRPGAAAVVQARAATGALPVYLTARADWLTDSTRSWLDAEALPPGPILFQASVKDSLSHRRTRRFKARVLADLTARGLEIRAAYGNARTDIDAFADAEVSADRVFIVGPHAGEDGTVPIKDYREHLKALSDH